MEHLEIEKQSAEAIRRIAVQQSHPVRRHLMTMAQIMGGGIELTPDNSALIIDLPVKVDGVHKARVETIYQIGVDGEIVATTTIRHTYEDGVCIDDK